MTPEERTAREALAEYDDACDNGAHNRRVLALKAALDAAGREP